jgi:hypothetical protein
MVFTVFARSFFSGEGDAEGFDAVFAGEDEDEGDGETETDGEAEVALSLAVVVRVSVLCAISVLCARIAADGAQAVNPNTIIIANTKPNVTFMNLCISFV